MDKLPPLNITQLKGKVVLIDFWTYSCINCIRSIPHLNAWQREYGGNGLVIIGVSTPEFQFEHNYSNVYAAVKKFNITYAVALDNNYSTWDAYGNEYWPAEYLIDKNGDIRYASFGEGDYNTTENVIRATSRERQLFGARKHYKRASRGQFLADRHARDIPRLCKGEAAHRKCAGLPAELYCELHLFQCHAEQHRVLLRRMVQLS